MEANSEQRAARFDIDFDDRPVFDSYSDNLDDGPVYDTDADADDLDHGSIIAAPTTTIDTSSTCSTKCPHAAIHTELARCGAVVLLPHCKVFTTSCSSTGDLGVLFLEDKWSVAYGRAAVDVYDHQCWDPGVLEAPKVTRFWVNFASHATLIWDPGLSRHRRTIMLIRPSANSAAAIVRGFPILWLMQRKCGGGYPGRNLDCNVLAYGIHGCTLSSELKVLQFHHAIVSRAVKPLVISEDSDSSWTLHEVAGLLDVHWLVAAVSSGFFEELLSSDANFRFHVFAYAQLQVSVGFEGTGFSWGTSCWPYLYLWGL
jgi:hypothetical protein